MYIQLPNGPVHSSLHDRSPYLSELLDKLAVGEKEENLADNVFKNDGNSGLSTLYFHLERFKKKGLLNFIAGSPEAPLSKLIPMTRPFALNEEIDIKTQKYQLSRFCILRHDKEDWVLETPLGHARLVIKSQEMHSLLFSLKEPKTFTEICKQCAHLSSRDIQDCLILLANMNAFTFCEKDHQLEQWEWHDLLFHSRSRLGRHNYPFGGLYPFKDKVKPLPVVKPSIGAAAIALYRPELEELKNRDQPFTEVLEKRCSIREPGPALNIQILGEFLFRAARVKKTLPSPVMECSHRPSPAGGAVHELEIYPVISSCEGLEPGVYHYNPLEHFLLPVTKDNDHVVRLMKDVLNSTGQKNYPQVLFVFTARFQRLSWKYRSVSYALTLKNAGVLTQTMYLVATAMSLSPCAVGGGDSDLFSKIIGSDYYEETSVGEFILS